MILGQSSPAMNPERFSPDAQAACRFRCSASKLALPNVQRNVRDLARQRETRKCGFILGQRKTRRNL